MSTPFYDLASLVVVPSGYKASKVYAQKPLTTDGQLTFSRASTATRVNASGALETVSSNVPRLDYTNSTCPKLLLEPQRVNRITQSNNFSHADWSKISFGPGSSDPVVTANYATSPFGSNDAWRLQATIGSSGFSLLQQAPFISGQHTASLWVKSNTSSNQSVYFRASTSATPVTVTPTWTRISVTESQGDYLTIGLRDIAGQANVSIDISIYAGQLENGAYPTSIIPTTTAAVTRLADACSKTGISSLIGQTEGTIYFEAQRDNSDQDFRVQISDGTTSNWLFVSIETGLNIRAFCISGGNFQFSTYSASPVSNARHKVAMAYANNDVKVYVDGIALITITSGSIPATSRLDFGSSSPGNVAVTPSLTSQALLFKTRLTNAQLAELTAL